MVKASANLFFLNLSIVFFEWPFVNSQKPLDPIKMKSFDFHSESSFTSGTAITACRSGANFLVCLKRRSPMHLDIGPPLKISWGEFGSMSVPLTIFLSVITKLLFLILIISSYCAVLSHLWSLDRSIFGTRLFPTPLVVAATHLQSPIEAENIWLELTITTLRAAPCIQAGLRSFRCIYLSVFGKKQVPALEWGCPISLLSFSYAG